MGSPLYSPYCGDDNCRLRMPRTKWNTKLDQFVCGCGWVSEFPREFIQRYKAKWSIHDKQTES